MVKVINNHVEKKLTIAEIFDRGNTCILEDGKIAIDVWMDADLFNKLNKDDSILCLTVDDDGESMIEYVPIDTPATPCDVEITVD